MKNIKIQIKSGQCGVYNLANILQDENILTYAEKEEFIPSGVIEFNRILNDIGYDFMVSPLVGSISFRFKIPKTFVKKVIMSLVSEFKMELDNECILFILYTQHGKTRYDNHAVSLVYKDGKFAYSDPLKEQFETLDSIDDVFDKCDYVSAIYTFECDTGFCCIGHNAYKSLFNDPS